MDCRSGFTEAFSEFLAHGPLRELRREEGETSHLWFGFSFLLIPICLE